MLIREVLRRKCAEAMAAKGTKCIFRHNLAHARLLSESCLIDPLVDTCPVLDADSWDAHDLEALRRPTLQPKLDHQARHRVGSL